MKKSISIILLVLISLNGYSQKRKKRRASERKQNIVETVIEVSDESKDNQTLKRKVAIARFSNETSYAKGLFYDKLNDPMGKQAVDILSTKLASSGKFILLVPRLRFYVLIYNTLHKHIVPLCIKLSTSRVLSKSYEY